jgi:hypothetical protein
MESKAARRFRLNQTKAYRDQRTCGCSKREKGRPRLSKGLCYMGSRNRLYRQRKQMRELNRLIRNGIDLDSDQVVLLENPLVEKD